MTSVQTRVPFLDLKLHHRAIWPAIEEALETVTSEAQFILGPAVERFETAFARYVGARHCVGLNSGTSALHMALLACGVSPGDEVITTPHTWISTTWAISYVGARPVFVDIDPATYNLDPARVEAAITPRTKAILPVHLYGQSCDMDALTDIAARHKLVLVEDAAQAHGAKWKGRRLGTLGRLGCFSFYPGKNLGAFGEGGAVVTDDDEAARRIRCLRDHAQQGRHHHVELGFNTRMEGIQGAVLEVKLRHLDAWNAARARHARLYGELLGDTPGLVLPEARQPAAHVWHLFVVLVHGKDRDALARELAGEGVATAVHYPTPVPLQPAYAHLGHRRGDFPVAEDVMSHCLSLPMFAELTEEQIVYVCDLLRGHRDNPMELAGKTVLVTGGAGFIGSHLVDALADCRVRVLDDLSTGQEENLAQHAGRSGFELMHGDVRDRIVVAKALRGVDVVFHLACRGVRHSIGNPGENHDVNATGTLVLLGEARRAGVQRFVHVSSSEVYGTARQVPMDENHPTFPETVYGAAKLAGECYARAYHQTYGFPSVVVRPFNNFGPRSHAEGDSGEVIPRFAVWALHGQPPVIFGDGRQTRDFIYVTDTAFWLRRMAETDGLAGQTVNLASGAETSVLELAELVYAAVGQGRREPQFHPPRPGDVRRHLGGMQRARQLLGFQTRVGLREGIARLVEHLRARPEKLAELLRGAPAVNWVLQRPPAEAAVAREQQP